mmetsp:Transcript_65/g.198  ORF Transcript_65/g.198 Transcript_65/m.198 type:complete len:360 (+) Transcript_65:562-1641(+)
MRVQGEAEVRDESGGLLLVDAAGAMGVVFVEEFVEALDFHVGKACSFPQLQYAAAADKVGELDEGLRVHGGIDVHVFDVQGLDNGLLALCALAGLPGDALAGRGEVHQGLPSRVLVERAVIVLVVIEGLLDQPHLALIVESHEADELSVIQGAGVVVVDPSQQHHHFLDRGAITAVVHDIAQLNTIDVPAAVGVELIEDEPDLIQFRGREAILLVQHLHEVNEGVVIQGPILQLVPMAPGPRDGDHLLDGILRNREAELDEEHLQLPHVDAAAAVLIRLLEGLRVGVELLVAHSPGPDEHLGQVQAQWGCRRGAALVVALGPVEEFRAELHGVLREGGPEKGRQHIGQSACGQLDASLA